MLVTSAFEAIRRSARTAAALVRAGVWVLCTPAEYGQGNIPAAYRYQS